MAFSDEDVSVFFADGDPVSFAGAAAGTKGHLDVADELMAAKDRFSGIIGTMQVVLIEATAAALALRMGDPITVDGLNYTVAHHARLADGKIMRVYLADA